MRRLLPSLLLLCGCARAHLGMARFHPLPAAPSTAAVSVAVIHEGRARPLFRALADAHDGTLDLVSLEMSSIVVRHGDDVLLVDAGLGRELAAQMQAFPLSRRLALGLSDVRSTADALDRAHLSRERLQIAITHLHYDHASAIAELAPAPVLVRPEELAALRAPDALDHGYLPAQLDGAEARLRPVAFDGPPVLVFARSHDVYGDGTVRLVPLDGHTPGSMGVLVQAGRRTLLFVGDAVYLRAAVAHRSGRGIPLRNLSDHDWRQARETVGLLAELAERAPEVEIIPSHDAEALATLPSL